MLKYIALLKVDMPYKWYEWYAGSTASYYKSPIFDNKEEVEDWLTTELAKYPDARVNCNIADRKYFIHTTIIAFDVEESHDVETFLEQLIPF